PFHLLFPRSGCSISRSTSRKPGTDGHASTSLGKSCYAALTADRRAEGSLIRNSSGCRAAGSRLQAHALPRAILEPLKGQAVVQAVLAALPQLDTHGPNADASPMLRARHLLVRKAFAPSCEADVHGSAALHGAALITAPRTDPAGPRPRREVGI